MPIQAISRDVPCMVEPYGQCSGYRECVVCNYSWTTQHCKSIFDENGTRNCVYPACPIIDGGTCATLEPTPTPEPSDDGRPPLAEPPPTDPPPDRQQNCLNREPPCPGAGEDGCLTCCSARLCGSPSLGPSPCSELCTP